MRRFELWLSLLVVVVIPGIMLRFFLTEPDHLVPEVDVTEQTQTKTDEIQEDLIRILHEGKILTMSLEDYLCGVLFGEMPASFQEDALKAQAVAARTYTIRKLRDADKHIDADLCTDSTCCQAYAETESKDSMLKIRAAVDATAGQVLVYDGDLIEATYFSCSGGRTEAAVAVWGTDIPYLQAVDSPWETDAKYHRDTVVFSEREVMDRLGFSDPTQSFTYSDIIYTDGYGVESMWICGKQFTGVQLRSMLDLRSTAFTIEKDEESICFVTRGYGHRVGMSQYGAEAMAQQGYRYDEILAYYYPNTQLITLDAQQLSRPFDKEGNL